MTAEDPQLIPAENAALKTLPAELLARVAGFEALQIQNAELLAQVAKLQAQLAQNSGNSSKPPSSDGFNPPPKNTNRSLRRATGKKPGGQAGHEGHSLSWNDQPSQIIEHLPDRCNQ